MIWLILIIGSLVMIGLGLKAKSDSETDFFLAGRSLGPLVGGCTLLATYYSGWVFIGSSGIAYEYGYIEMANLAAYLPPIFLVVLLFANHLKKQTDKMGSLTVPEYLGKIHGHISVQLLSVVLTLLLMFVFLTSQLKAMAILMSPLLKISIPLAIIILGGIVVVYTLLGGMTAVAWTDTLQAFGMLIAALAVIFIVFTKTSLGELTADLQSISPDLINADTSEPYGRGKWAFLLTIPYSFIFLMATPYLTIRIMSVKKDIKWHRMALYILPFTIIWSLTPFVGAFMRVNMPGLESPDSAMPLFLENYVPAIFIPILAFLFMMAMQSSCDSIIHNMASTISYDLRNIFSKDRFTQKQSMLINRLSVLLIGSIAIFVTILIPPSYLIWLGILGVGPLMAALIGPLVVSTFWRGNSVGAVVSMLGGSIFTAWTLIADSLGWVEAPVYGAVLGIILYVVVSKLTFAISPRIVDDSFKEVQDNDVLIVRS